MTVPYTHPEQQLRQLEEKVDALLLLCERLQHENDTLNSLMQEWVAERTEWTEQTDIAKRRVETMISRLQSMVHKT